MRVTKPQSTYTKLLKKCKTITPKKEIVSDVMSPWLFFISVSRQNKEYHNVTYGDLCKKLSPIWKQMDSKEKQTYVDMYKQSKKKFLCTMSTLTDTQKKELRLHKRLRRARKKRKFTPKPPDSAYILFARDNRPHIIKDNPHMTFCDIGKTLGQQWRNLNDSDKQVYCEKAKTNFEAHVHKMQRFKEKCKGGKYTKEQRVRMWESC
jgi:hypothetical protein